MAKPLIDKSKKQKYLLAAVSFVVMVIAVYFLFIFQAGPKELKEDDTVGEVKDISEIALSDKPYVSLTPTADGAEIIISVERMSYFDRIEYELTYLADDPTRQGEKIQRGSTGTDVNTKDEKYKKSILLGTASRGVRSPDRGVADGKLIMHMIKGDVEYLSETEWSLFETGASDMEISDSRDKIKLDVAATLGKTYWVILADTIGVPPSFDKDIETVVTPVYGTFSVAPKFTSPATLTLELDGLQSPQIHLYSQDGKWETKEPDSQGNTLSTDVNNYATFVVTAKK
jgi:hypothetical protein